MGEIKLDRADSLRVINDADASPDARLIAACALAFFEAMDSAADVEGETVIIAHKLLRMSAATIDQEREAAP